MVKIFSKKSLKCFSFALLVAFALSSCATKQNVSQDNNSLDVEITENQRNLDMTNPDNFLNTLQAEIVSKWPHLGKIWPGLDFSNIGVIVFFLDKEDKTSTAWLLTSSEMRELKPEEYEGIEPPFKGLFDELNFNGINTIVFATDIEEFDKPATDFYKFMTHELVHFYFQDEVDQSENSSRDEIYPINYNSKNYRNMILKRLSDAILANTDELTQENIQKAAFWYNKWKTEFPGEVDSIREIDIAEGHANYIGLLATLADKDSITRENVQQLVTPTQGAYTTIDSISYPLGLVSLYLLELKDPNLKNTFLASKKSPVEFLLDDVTPIDDTEDEKLANELKEEIEKVNKTAGEDIQNIITGLADKNVPYLKVNGNYGIGSISLSGFLSYEGTSIYVNYTAEYKQDESNSLTIRELSSINDSGRSIIIPLTPDLNFEIKDDVMTLNNEALKGSLRVTTSVEDGRTIYTTK